MVTILGFETGKIKYFPPEFRYQNLHAKSRIRSMPGCYAIALEFCNQSLSTEITKSMHSCSAIITIL